MRKWEYREMTPSNLLVERGRESEYLSLEAALNALGALGWEHYWTNANGNMLLKRAVEEAPPPAPAASPKVEVKRRSSGS